MYSSYSIRKNNCITYITSYVTALALTGLRVPNVHLTKQNSYQHVLPIIG